MVPLFWLWAKVKEFLQAPTSCCNYFDGQGKCTFPAGGRSKSWCDPATEKFNCSMPNFMGASMMNVDMGLYIKFEVDEGDDNGLGQGRHGH